MLSIVNEPNEILYYENYLNQYAGFDPGSSEHLGPYDAFINTHSDSHEACRSQIKLFPQDCRLNESIFSSIFTEKRLCYKQG